MEGWRDVFYSQPATNGAARNLKDPAEQKTCLDSLNHGHIYRRKKLRSSSELWSFKFAAMWAKLYEVGSSAGKRNMLVEVRRPV